MGGTADLGQLMTRSRSTENGRRVSVTLSVRHLPRHFDSNAFHSFEWGQVGSRQEVN